jgi:hypothetical protein
MMLSSNRSVCCLAVVIALSAAAAPAKTTNNITDLRELRLACLDTFDAARSRLDELHGFVEQQAARERSAANELLTLQYNAGSAKLRIDEFKKHQIENKTRVETARNEVQRVTTSYIAAGKALPMDDKWATEGSIAINDLKRAVAADPQIEWKRTRLQEVESEYLESYRRWRSARRSFEKVNFDLELRASPAVFNRIQDAIKSTDAELDSLSALVAERETALAALSKDSSRWDTAMQALYEQMNMARKRLATSKSAFHLVDLKFAAWRLAHSEDRTEALAVMPDAQEVILAADGYMRLPPAGSPGPAPASALEPINGIGADASMGRVLSPPAPSVPAPDPAFAELLRRAGLCIARLNFISGLLEAEEASVLSAVSQVENAEAQAASAGAETANMAAQLETLRRAQQKEQLALASGLETLDLVNKRFASDYAAITRLLDDVATRTDKLEKSLEKQ